MENPNCSFPTVRGDVFPLQGKGETTHFNPLRKVHTYRTHSAQLEYGLNKGNFGELCGSVRELCVLANCAVNCAELCGTCGVVIMCRVMLLKFHITFDPLFDCF